MTIETISTAKVHGGTQGIYRHTSKACKCDMTFAVFVPPQAEDGPVPVVWYLSGLTCTHQNVMDKGEYRRMAAELGLIVVCPDTSPRGGGVPDYIQDWQRGTGAGFYLDATLRPWSKNYRMYSYITNELPAIISDVFPADMSKQSLIGHSMGGHGALTIALKNPDTFASCSAFAPIVAPSVVEWGQNALSMFLGGDRSTWRAYDACALIEDGAHFPEFLIDQGSADSFLDDGLKPHLFDQACENAGIPLTLNMREGYDHSYNFISTFMDSHLKWAAERLKRNRY